MMKWLKKLFIPLVLLFSTVTVCFSSWLVPESSTTITTGSASNSTTRKKVAYLASDTTTFYTSIEKAVEVANKKGNDTVYVIPGVTTTIQSNIELKNNTKLILPYNGETYYNYTEINAQVDGAGGKKYFVNEDYRTTLVNVAANKTITIKTGSELIVSGITGTNGTPYSGHTSGTYTEICLYSGANIICNGGTLSVYGGYITESTKGNGSYLTMNSGTMYAPFVIYDYKGGTTTLGINNRDKGTKYCPFTIFDLINIQTFTTIAYGTLLFGKTKLAINNQFSFNDIPLAGPSSSGSDYLFKMEEGCNIKFKFNLNNESRLPEITDPASASVYNNDEDYTDWFIEGPCSFGGFSVTVSLDTGIPLIGVVSRTVNTSDFDLPLSYKFKMYISSGANLNASIDFKLMPGSTLIIEEDAIFTASKRAFVHDGNFEDAQTVYPYPTNKGDARVEVRGTFNLASSSTFGGLIYAGSESAIINCETSNLNIVIYESDGKNPESASSAIYSKSGAITITKTAQIYKYSSDKTTATNQGAVNILNSKPIYSVVNISSALYWTISNASYTIKLSSNDGSSEIGSYTFTNDTTSYVLPGSVGENSLKGWTTTKSSIEPQFDPSEELFLDEILSYFSADSGGRVLNLYAVLEETTATQAKLTIITNNSNNYDTLNDLSYSITSEKHTGTYSDTSIEISDFVVGDTFTFTPNSGVKSYVLKGFTDNTATSGQVELKISSAECSIDITRSGTTCLIPSTLITLADGTQKQVKDIVAGDELLVMNHETGMLDTSPVVFNDKEEYGWYDVTYLRFSNGEEIGISYEHGFFDRTLNEYVYITNSNGEDFIGHTFYTENGDITLTSVETVREYTELYSPVTAWHLNYFTNGVLSMPGGIEGLFNIFEYEEDSLKYDEFLMQQDIEQYGLFTYEDFKDYVPYEFYAAFPAPYLKVSIGKGYITFEEVLRLIERYSKLV